MATKGIDVSKWQKTIDWNKVKQDGIKFAVLRAGYGSSVSQKDSYFKKNYSACKAIGLPVGAYWYSYATTTDGAKKEAYACLSVIKGKSFDFPVYFDQEYEPEILALSDNQRTAICKAFCDAIKAAGYTPGIYASTDFINNKLNYKELEKYKIWAAQYASKCTCKAKFHMWQYTSSGTVNGVSGKVDMDYLYDSLKTENENQSSSTTNTTSIGGFNVATLSNVKNGSSGSLVKTLQILLNEKNGAKLSVDGICGAKTVSAIKAYQKKKNLSSDGICGQKTWESILTN